MTRCDACNKKVTSYKLKRGKVYCRRCFREEPWNLEGFRHNDKPIPTMTDHATNMGWEKPQKRTQNREYREMEVVSKHGGSIGKMPDLRPLVCSLARQNMERHSR